MKFTFKITELTHTELSDFLSTALYGSFWAGVDYDESDKEGVEIQSEYDEPCFDDILASILLGGKTITITDEEEETEYKLDLKTLLKGFNKVAKSEDYRHHVWNIINEDYDFNDADIVLQFAIFGEEMYA
jgi:hypothetical protein